ncbi:MAG: GxxExxY protein [Geminicoccaceae bacterium]|nr:GxxExxY protein [Geminicoccaceae bacterium]
MTGHRVFGPGFLESVYKNALAIELRKRGLPFEREKRITIRYEGETIGDFSADFLVDGGVIAEVKAIRAISSEHEKQLVHYLSATGMDIGLLLNFGSPRLEFRRKTRVYLPHSGRSDRRGNGKRQDGQDGQDGRMAPHGIFVILSILSILSSCSFNERPRMLHPSGVRGARSAHMFKP